MAYKGKFRPQNYKKYKGDHTKIIYRSGWELTFMKYLDRQPEVLRWSSEEIVIPYRSPIDNRLHRYFPDFWVKTVQGESLIEIKPKKQTRKPKAPLRMTRTYKNALITYERNRRKWSTAYAWCIKRNMKFLILTEDHLKTF